MGRKHSPIRSTGVEALRVMLLVCLSLGTIMAWYNYVGMYIIDASPIVNYSSFTNCSLVIYKSNTYKLKESL